MAGKSIHLQLRPSVAAIFPAQMFFLQFLKDSQHDRAGGLKVQSVPGLWAGQSVRTAGVGEVVKIPSERVQGDNLNSNWTNSQYSLLQNVVYSVFRGAMTANTRVVLLDPAVIREMNKCVLSEGETEMMVIK
jgi:hypothetical protein